MKGNDEGDFNAYLSKEFKKTKNNIMATKISDKFKSGLSDFLIWGNGNSCALETKFVTELPVRETSQILKHEFSGVQLRFMDRMIETGNLAYGLVAVKPLNMMFLLERRDIPADGQMTKEDLKKGLAFMPDEGDVQKLLEYVITPKHHFKEV